MIRHLGKIAALAVALAATPALAQSETIQGDPAVLLNGAWRMVSLEAWAPGGELAPVDYSGQIVFTDAGTIAVQAMNPVGDSPENPYTVAGYEAFYGRFTVSDDGRTFVIDVDSSLVRDMIGQDFERAFEVTDERLVLTPTNPEENWRVVYERD